ncbi:MAG TPA: hypothetical protein ENH82_18575 [bacterium]|nr:hypothetical protein [bacterium]
MIENIRIRLQKVSTTLFDLQSRAGLCFFRQCKKKKSNVGLLKNSHSDGSGDVPVPRHPATSPDVRAAAEQEPFLLAILSRLNKKLKEMTSAPLLHKATNEKYAVTA